MTQNNMVNFITLTDLDSNPVELNPAFIVLMRRDTYNPEDNVEMPMTKIYLSTNYNLFVIETPEEIAQKQMDTVAKIMESVMSITTDIVNRLDEEI